MLYNKPGLPSGYFFQGFATSNLFNNCNTQEIVLKKEMDVKTVIFAVYVHG